MTLYQLFDKYVYDYHGSNNTKNLIMGYIKQYKKFFLIDKDIKNITKDDIQNYINYEYYANDLQDVTIYNRFKRLKTIFNYAVKNNFINFNPCSDVNVKRVTYVRREIDCSKKNIKKIINAFKGHKYYELVYLALHSGLRKGELLALDKNKHFIYKQFLFWKIPRCIIVCNSRTYDNIEKQQIIKLTKNNKARYVYLDFRCSIFLYKYFKKIDNKLFDFNTNVVTTQFRKVIKEHNLGDIRFHDLRHIHASYLIAHAKNKPYMLKVVQERLGHSNIQQTYNTYAHLLTEDQKNAAKSFNFI